MARIYAIKVLSYALSGATSDTLAIHFINAGGMKRIFPIFMGKGTKKLAAAYPDEYAESRDAQECISCILSLCKATASTSTTTTYRERLFNKFVENQGEKLVRLVTCFQVYRLRLGLVESDLDLLVHEDQRDLDVEYLRRLDAGLYTLQMISIVIATLALQDDVPDFSVRVLACTLTLYAYSFVNLSRSSSYQSARAWAWMWV